MEVLRHLETFLYNPDLLYSWECYPLISEFFAFMGSLLYSIFGRDGSEELMQLPNTEFLVNMKL